MLTKHKKITVVILLCVFCSRISGQVNSGDSGLIDSLNFATSGKVAYLLEQGKISEAMSYWQGKNEEERNKTYIEFEKIVQQVSGLRSKTKLLIQTSYKNYKDSFNINQLIYYNDEGRFYLYELFYLNNDSSSKIVDIFIKDPIALERKRKDINEFYKKHPDITRPP